MQTKANIFRLTGLVQHYNWGGHRFLPVLLRKENPSDQPFAEYWMGAHKNAPSLIENGTGIFQPLDQFIAREEKEVLGETVQKRFGRLPYLFKILDVKDMLSIQVHPSKETALIEFAAENEEGIPLDAPQRTYKDDNHKPELMVALSEFWLLHGFKPFDKLEMILQTVPELQFLLPILKKDGMERMYKVVMEMKQEEVNKRLQPLADRILALYISQHLSKPDEDFWAARAYRTFCLHGNIDRGLFSIYFFNLVKLEPGEAIFQDAGILHAYLEGQNLEIMANSDNVLRGGLTNKKVDVPELLKNVRFDPVEPQVILPQSGKSSFEKIFKTTAADFELSQFELGPGNTISLYSHTVEIFLVMEGMAQIRSGGDILIVNKGESFMATYGATVQVESRTDRLLLYRAGVPQ